MTHHVLRHKHRVEYLAVVNSECQTDKIRSDHRAARPCLDRLLRLRGFCNLDFIEQVLVNKRTFFNGSSHKKLFAFHWTAITAHQYKSVREFALVARSVSLGQQAPRRCQLLPASAGFGFARAAAIRMVNGIPRNAAVDRANATMTRTPRLAEYNIFMLQISNLADGGVTHLLDATNFP